MEICDDVDSNNSILKISCKIFVKKFFFTPAEVILKSNF